MFRPTLPEASSREPLSSSREMHSWKSGEIATITGSGELKPRRRARRVPTASRIGPRESPEKPARNFTTTYHFPPAESWHCSSTGFVLPLVIFLTKPMAIKVRISCLPSIPLMVEEHQKTINATTQKTQLPLTTTVFRLSHHQPPHALPRQVKNTPTLFTVRNAALSLYANGRLRGELHVAAHANFVL